MNKESQLSKKVYRAPIPSWGGSYNFCFEKDVIKSVKKLREYTRFAPNCGGDVEKGWLEALAYFNKKLDEVFGDE